MPVPFGDILVTANKDFSDIEMYPRTVADNGVLSSGLWGPEHSVSGDIHTAHGRLRLSSRAGP